MLLFAGEWSGVRVLAPIAAHGGNAAFFCASFHAGDPGFFTYTLSYSEEEPAVHGAARSKRREMPLVLDWLFHWSADVSLGAIGGPASRTALSVVSDTSTPFVRRLKG